MEMAAKTAGSRAYLNETAHSHVMEFAVNERRPSQMAETTDSGRTLRNGGIPLSHIIDSLDKSIPLPRDLRSFLIYCTVLAGIAAGMLIHVLLSAQILEAKVELADMQDYLTVVERQNGELLWLIGRATNFEYVRDKALAEGYTPIKDRQFVQVDISGDHAQPLSVADTPQGAQPQTAAESEEETPVPAAGENLQAITGQAEASPQTASQSAPEDTSAAPDRLQVMRQWRGAILPSQRAPAQPANDGRVPADGQSNDDQNVAATGQPAQVETEPNAATPDWFSELMKNVGVLFARAADD